MPIWRIAPVIDEPEVSLSRWKILETADGIRHFVGADSRDRTGRVSSEVVTFDPRSLRGETRSGRIYQLIGEPGRSDNADYVWKRWCELNSVTAFVDVTKQLLIGAEDDNSI
ncbi:hypothetical protein WJ47_00160 [Burkholderia ubonensis]|uniref:Uncharacterized protein n=1 Tax=Burkholderia ubonensis TaxID=101571 RepID=A0AB73FY65_9BURK|nr:hypothetical protein [Burkholderia ubonensis]KVK93974.1 hypothetical protein WJ44_23405 [Burkholderia ubonensis]KVL65053.1 hypothetical protein WJ47_00160 [Burkholderia ubonensis]KVM26272.1 hypothetical protein WJ53_12140 [Burkholderia ubonensis]KVM40663.1 hypothetical protein WJ54_03055 [Burkholderia ubonensis]